MELYELADRADAVGDVVEAFGEGMDVLAVEGRDDRTIEPLQDGPRQQIALTLDLHELIDTLWDVGQFSEQLRKDPSAFVDVDGRLRVQVEEPFVAGNQSKSHDDDVAGPADRRTLSASGCQSGSFGVSKLMLRPSNDAAPGRCGRSARAVSRAWCRAASGPCGRTAAATARASPPPRRATSGCRRRGRSA